MAERELVSREELRERLNEEIANRPECAGVRVEHLPTPLQEADPSGCNWDQYITVALDTNMKVGFPEDCKEAIAQAITRVAERYNLA